MVDASRLSITGIRQPWEALQVSVLQPHNVDSHHIRRNSKKGPAAFVIHVAVVLLGDLANAIVPMLLVPPHNQAHPHASTLVAN